MTFRHEMMLTPKAPFSFAQSLRFLGAFQPAKNEQSTIGRSLTKAFQLNGVTVALRIEEASDSTVDHPRLQLTLISEQALEETRLAAAEDRARFYLSLDDDLQPFYALADGDRRFQTVIQNLYGYHQVKFGTPFESACWAILTQRMSIPVARGIKDAFAEHFGGSIEVDGARLIAFPEPGVIAAASADKIRAIIRDEKKADAIHAIARAFDLVEEHWLREAPIEEVYSWLRNQKRIGDWSAGLILLRGLGRSEGFALGEDRVTDAARALYGVQPLEEVKRIGAGYGPYLGYWAHYLRAAS